MRRLSKKHTLVIGLLGAIGLLLWFADRERAEGTETIGGERGRSYRPSTRVHHTSAANGLSAVPSDGALPPLAWGEKRLEYERLLRDATQITPHEPDDTRFLELGQLLLWTIPVGLPEDDGRLAAECAAKYEPRLQRSCHWRTDYVIRRIDGKEVAELEYIQVTPTNDNDDPACLAFASCTAAIWARQVDVPMPRSLGDVFAFHEFGRGARWTPSKGDQEQFYRQALEESRRQLEYFYSQGDLNEYLADPISRYNFEWTQRHIEEYENMLAAIEQRKESDVQ